MKINLDTALLAIDAALAAFILVHLQLELATAIIFVIGFAAIVGHDYGRNRDSLKVDHAVTPFPAPVGENLPLAS